MLFSVRKTVGSIEAETDRERTDVRSANDSAMLANVLCRKRDRICGERYRAGSGSGVREEGIEQARIDRAQAVAHPARGNKIGTPDAPSPTLV
jgi:hypothetical protein